ncbi:MAG: hypothetical protein KC635_16580, partial [Myxococcales bacterium]|nr:hypothetical protein [Myxococcales bacterium]
RWRLVDGHADGQAAMLQEGVADFIAAARLETPILTASATTDDARSIAGGGACPDALQGDAHADAQVVSGALWEAREAVGAERLLAAIAAATPGHASDIASWSEAVATALGALSRRGPRDAVCATPEARRAATPCRPSADRRAPRRAARRPMCR